MARRPFVASVLVMSVFATLVGLGVPPAAGVANRTIVYGVSPFFNDGKDGDDGGFGLQPFDAVSGHLAGPGRIINITSGPVTGVALGATALTRDPVSGDVYALVNPGPNQNSDRYLSTIDLATGEATSIAKVIDNTTVLHLSALTFDEAGGILYGLSGHRGTCKACLYTINKATGAATEIKDLVEENDGEALAINPADDKLYRLVGSGADHMQTIDPNDAFVTADVDFIGTPPAEPFGMVWNPATSAFIVTDIQADIWSVAADGTSTQRSSFDPEETEESLRGFVLESFDDAVAIDDRLTVAKAAGETDIDVKANDIDGSINAVGDIISFTQPTRGDVELTATGLNYDPDDDYCNTNVGETDRFSYTLDSGWVAMVRVSITCPVIPSTITVKYSKASSVFKGVVTNPEPACLAGRSIEIVKEKNTGDVVIATTTTTSGGAYKVKKKAGPGLYHAEIADSPSIPRVGICGAANSTSIRVR